MRTTLTIDAEVLAAFKRQAAETHKTLSSLIESALREHLATCSAWLRSVYAGDEAFGLCAPVLIGLVRILTHPRGFRPPDTHEEAFGFVHSLVGHPNAVLLNPGRDHLRLFERLSRAADARGDLVPDAYLAALAIETGAVLVSGDADFGRFPDLRWQRL